MDEGTTVISRFAIGRGPGCAVRFRKELGPKPVIKLTIVVVAVRVTFDVLVVLWTLHLYKP